MSNRSSKTLLHALTSKCIQLSNLSLLAVTLDFLKLWSELNLTLTSVDNLSQLSLHTRCSSKSHKLVFHRTIFAFSAVFSLWRSESCFCRVLDSQVKRWVRVGSDRRTYMNVRVQEWPSFHRPSCMDRNVVFFLHWISQVFPRRPDRCNHTLYGQRPKCSKISFSSGDLFHVNLRGALGAPFFFYMKAIRLEWLYQKA